MTRLRYMVWLLLALSFGSACSNTDNYNELKQGGVVSIAHLKSLCRDRQVVIRQGIRIEGKVTANDLYGEYSQSIVIEDPTAGIEISIEGWHLHQKYRYGESLSIFCEGLMLGNLGGKIVLGTESDEYIVGRLSSQEQELHISAIDKNISLEPKELSISELDIKWADRLVTLKDVRFPKADGVKVWVDIDSLGNRINTSHIVVNRQGDSLRLYMPSTCRYANEPLPEGYGTIYGIGDHYGSTPSLRITNHGIEFPSTTDIK